MLLRLAFTGLFCLVILTPADAGEPPAFFNGKDLAGWRGKEKLWTVKEGAIVGSTEPDGLKGNTFLVSEREFADFELRFKVRLKGKGANSGVQIRSKLVDTREWVVWGPQCDIGDVYWGSLFGEHFGGAKEGEHKMLKAADREILAKALKVDDFNDYRIRCVGKRVTIQLNGVTTVDEEIAILPDKGVIAWQLHGGGPMEVVFKDIEFKELRSER
jgi:hypothetical protein